VRARTIAFIIDGFQNDKLIAGASRQGHSNSIPLGPLDLMGRNELQRNSRPKLCRMLKKAVQQGRSR
jgi:hypothetical protein